MEEQATSLGHTPTTGKWEFDDTVERVFDDMLERSIPQLATMRATVAALAARYVRPGTDVVDLGASRGGAIAPLLNQFGARCRYVLVERSPAMLDALRTRFAGWTKTGVMTVFDMDLREHYPPCLASVVLSILTMMFVPVEYRPVLLARITARLPHGSCLILVEKVVGSTGGIDEAIRALYYDFKCRAGYSQEEIDRKRLSLEGVLVPLTARANEDALRAAGFREVECFWRWMCFAGWIAVK